VQGNQALMTRIPGDLDAIPALVSCGAVTAVLQDWPTVHQRIMSPEPQRRGLHRQRGGHAKYNILVY
jgi:hypothetical protein